MSELLLSQDWKRGLRDGVMMSIKHLINFRHNLYVMIEEDNKCGDKAINDKMAMIDLCIDELNELLETCNAEIL